MIIRFVTAFLLTNVSTAASHAFFGFVFGRPS